MMQKFRDNLFKIGFITISVLLVIAVVLTIAVAITDKDDTTITTKENDAETLADANADGKEEDNKSTEVHVNPDAPTCSSTVATLNGNNNNGTAECENNSGSDTNEAEPELDPNKVYLDKNDPNSVLTDIPQVEEVNPADHPEFEEPDPYYPANRYPGEDFTYTPYTLAKSNTVDVTFTNGSDWIFAEESLTYQIVYCELTMYLQQHPEIKDRTFTLDESCEVGESEYIVYVKLHGDTVNLQGKVDTWNHYCDYTQI